MYITRKNYLRKKGYKIMYNGSNCNQKSQLSEIITELLNPRALETFVKSNINYKFVFLSFEK